MHAPLIRIRRALVLTTLAVSALIAVIPAQAQQVGARQWFANASQKCLYQFNGKLWINIGSCQQQQVMPLQAQQALPVGTVKRFAVGNLYCLHVLDTQRQWGNVGNCMTAHQLSRLTPQQRDQLDATLNQLKVEIAVTQRKLQAAQAQAAQSQGQAPLSVAQQRLKEANAQTQRDNEAGLAVVMGGMASNTQRQMSNSAYDRSQQDMQAAGDRQRAEMARIRGQSNAGALDAKARESATVR